MENCISVSGIPSGVSSRPRDQRLLKLCAIPRRSPVCPTPRNESRGSSSPTGRFLFPSEAVGMRLLVTETRELKEFPGSPPSYAIFSHRWREEEVTFKDLSRPDVQSMEGYSKFSEACETAQFLGFDYLWIDTCCIDKSDNVELSEAINSMYNWYMNSGICFAYLDDVTRKNLSEEFSGSEWFSRGWTLQELIAPAEVLFFDRNWTLLGTRASLATYVELASGIERILLLTRRFDGVSVAKKMSWASRRVTTRLEDEAYCLMGMFNVNMPAIYGEGRRAFIRLQEEILKQTNDHSIFAWGFRSTIETDIGNFTLSETRINFMADSPSMFEDSGDVVGIPFNELESMLGVPDLDREITPTYKGIRMCIPLKRLDASSSLCVAFLACKIETRTGQYILGMVLEKLGHHHYTRIGSAFEPLIEVPYDILLDGDVSIDERACIIRDAPFEQKPEMEVVMDISSLHKFCEESGFFISGHWRRSKSRRGFRWKKQLLEKSTCSFALTVKDSESSYLILKLLKEELSVGFAISITTEPNAYARGEQHLFSVEARPIKSVGSQEGPGSRFWKNEKDFGLRRSIFSSAVLPNGLVVMAMITCKEGVRSILHTHPYQGSFYELSVQAMSNF